MALVFIVVQKAAIMRMILLFQMVQAIQVLRFHLLELEKVSYIASHHLDNGHVFKGRGMPFTITLNKSNHRLIGFTVDIYNIHIAMRTFKISKTS